MNEKPICPACEREPLKKHSNGRYLKRGVCVDCIAQFEKEHKPKKEKKRGESGVDYESTPLDEASQHIGTCNFDLNEVLTRLGESVGNADASLSPELTEAISALLDWLVKVDFNHKNALRAIGLRTVAMAWVVNPERFQNASVRTLATKLGFTAANISPLTAEFSRQFKIRNQFQNHDWRNK